jgi:hypothetical protein
MKLVDQSLVVHLFAPLTGPDRARARTQLEQVWQACARHLGITEAIPAVGVPADPPDHSRLGGPDGSGPVAVRRAQGPALRQAMWIHEHDVACVSIALAGATPTAATWAELHAEWSSATAGSTLDTMIDIVEEYTAQITGSMVCADDVHAAAVCAALPVPIVAHAEPTWTVRGVGTRGGFAIWQTTPTADARPGRRLVILAPTGHDAQLSALIWCSGPPRLAPLTRYLLHAAKLRYQLRVWRRDQRVHQLRASAEATLHQLRRRLLTDASLTDASLTEADLDRAEDQLAALQVDEAGLIDAATQVHTMRRTAQIAATNMAAHAARITDADIADGGHLFAGDQTLGAWFDQQLDDDATYLGTARERAAQLGAVFDRELRRRRDQRRDAARHRHERFTLLQTALLGAVLMCLTAVQSLDYRLPLPAPVKPAVVAALGAATLYLSTTVLRLALPALRAGQRGAAWLHYTAGGLLAASTVWLAVAWIMHGLLGHPIAARIVLPLTAVVFAGATAITAWRDHHR